MHSPVCGLSNCTAGLRTVVDDAERTEAEVFGVLVLDVLVPALVARELVAAATARDEGD